MIYFDNAATTLIKPAEVKNAVIKAMEGIGNAGRGVNNESMDAARLIYDARLSVANFFGEKDPSRVVFTSNATESLNIAIKGILAAKDHVVTTYMEHNSVLRPLYEMMDTGVDVDFVKPNPSGVIDVNQLGSLIKKETKAIIVTHGSNLTGNLTDVKSIGKITQEKGIVFIVDASQTAGVFPIDVNEMNIDILCFTGHKSLMALQGIGGMIVKKGIDIKPLKSGGTGVQTYNKKQPKEMPTRLEAGTLNGHGIASLNASIKYITSVGLQNIQKKEAELTKTFYEGIKDIPGIKVYGDFSCFERCPIVTININDFDSSFVGDVLYNDYGISVRTGGHCAPLAHEALNTVETGAVRFSFSYNNTLEEINEAIKAVKEISNEKSN